MYTSADRAADRRKKKQKKKKGKERKAMKRHEKKERKEEKKEKGRERNKNKERMCSIRDLFPVYLLFDFSLSLSLSSLIPPARIVSTTCYHMSPS